MLFFLALGVRLWRIEYPESVVFDELHLGWFVNPYRDGQYFFDIHPPLGRLVLLVASWVFGNEPALDCKEVGAAYGSTKYVPLRATNALFGAGFASLVYGICREVGLSAFASAIPAVMQALDMLVVIETRIILLEGQLLFFMGLCLICALGMCGTKKGTMRSWMYVVATALADIAAISVKRTALATPGLVAIISFFGVVFPAEGRLDAVEMEVAGVIAIVFYLGEFFLHFKILQRNGDGDDFMLIPFRRTLVGNSEYYDPSAPHPWLINIFI